MIETKDVIATRFTLDLARKLEFTVGDRPTPNLQEKAQDRVDELINQYRMRYSFLFNETMKIRVHLTGQGILLEASPALDRLMAGE